MSKSPRCLYDSRIETFIEKEKESIFAALVTEVLRSFPGEGSIDPNWVISPYAPTPTIIEAARTLYESHSVDDITRHEAD